jgi:hypothetical protein
LGPVVFARRNARGSVAGIIDFYRERADRAAQGLPEPAVDNEWADEYECEIPRLKALEPPCPKCGLPLGVAKSYCGDGCARHPG